MAKDLPLTSIHESCFWDEDDPRWGAMGIHRETPSEDEFNDLDLSQDSYIFCFSGWRGAGKTTAMTICAMKANWLFGMRLVANYPIEYRLNTLDGKSRVIKAELLDLYKLLCFDQDYRNCLILIDEAPDVISHLASMTWKNRLLNIFVREIRKNRSSLFLAAQQVELIDKSMRWQTDVIVQCEDGSRRPGNRELQRSEAILLEVMDNSGMWAGKTWQQIESANRHHGTDEPLGLRTVLYPRASWGIKGETKPVYDTYFQQDIWESLKKVDMKFASVEIGPGSKQDEGDYKQVAASLIEMIQGDADLGGMVSQKKFFSSIPDLSKTQKDALSKKLSDVPKMRDGGGNRAYDFTGLDANSLLS